MTATPPQAMPPTGRNPGGRNRHEARDGASVQYAPLPDDDDLECVVCDQRLQPHDEPRFRVVVPHGTVCPDCAPDADPALAAAVRVLNLANTLGRRLPPGTPALDAFHATILRGLRTLREQAGRTEL